uniref:Uncharacterized protein n=1 Tax=Oryza meridionalis TaxID=40149 RepID=A0A0E0F093_9ORYZ
MAHRRGSGSERRRVVETGGASASAGERQLSARVEQRGGGRAQQASSNGRDVDDVKVIEPSLLC